MRDLPQTKPAGRNEPCPCGSRKKHKKCCMVAERLKTEEFYRRLYTPPEKPAEATGAPQSAPASPRPGMRRGMRSTPLMAGLLVAATLAGMGSMGGHEKKKP